MPANKKVKVVYVTSSKYKEEENKIFTKECKFTDGTMIGELFMFEIRSIPIKEVLEVDISVMVQAEVVNAYSQLKVPCIVEHAGLLFEDCLPQPYPGGLTKPMWNALGERFVQETNSAGRNVIAQAVVAFCNGLEVYTYTGETKGKIAEKPRGSRAFYWDTVFIPGDKGHNPDGLTYAEIVDSKDYGLEHKVTKLSQSTRAMISFLEDLQLQPKFGLWDQG